MKRIIFLLIALCAYASVSAADLSDSQSWIPSSVRIGLGNDKWTNGISRNDDDQLSYSENIAIEAPAWKLAIDFDGITDRGWKDDWFTGDDEDMDTAKWYDGRYDAIDASFTLKTTILDTDYFDIEFNPYIGLLFVGDFGFDWIQNMIHTISHIHLVDIPYEVTDLYIFPQLGAAARLKADIPANSSVIDKSAFGFSLELMTDNAIGYETNQYIGLSVYLKSDYDILRLSFGHEWIQTYTGWKTHELLAWYNNGWIFSFGLKAGALSLDYYTDIEHTFGYTTVMIDFMSFFEEAAHSKTDIFMNFSMDKMLSKSFATTQLGIPLAKGASVILTNRYIAGNPLYAEAEEIEDLHYYFRDKLAFSSWLFGFRYDFPSDWCNNWFTFYASFSMGLQSFMFSLVSNMVPDVNAPSSDTSYYAFAMDAELGVVIVPDGLLKAGNASYRFFISGGFTYYPDPLSYYYLELLEPDRTSAFIEMRLIPRVSLGVQIGLDI